MKKEKLTCSGVRKLLLRNGSSSFVTKSGFKFYVQADELIGWLGLLVFHAMLWNDNRFSDEDQRLKNHYFAALELATAIYFYR